MSDPVPKSDDQDHHGSVTAAPASAKSVTIDSDPEEISPMLVPQQSPKLHRVSLSGKKMTGRPMPLSAASSSTSLSRQISNLRLDQGAGGEAGAPPTIEDPAALFSQVAAWLQEQKARADNKSSQSIDVTIPSQNQEAGERDAADKLTKGSQASDDALALSKLERILYSHVTTKRGSISSQGGSARTPFATLRKSSIAKKFKPKSLSQGPEMEAAGELDVPDVEAILDNSKTVTFAGAGSDGEIESVISSKDKECWITFKKDIVKLTHTLKLKRWRTVPIESGGDIKVERLCGALTNAVYVVSPPESDQYASSTDDASASTAPKKRPIKLLLRIYGPQSGHLIDREKELSILRRLSQKNIGARMLGTFTNGRFEQFLNARTLTAEDLRIPGTSVQIAKRMRELHDGISLLDDEREHGPAVWMDWDKWVQRAETIVTWLDKQVLSNNASQLPNQGQPWISRGLVCGVEWPLFRKTVDKYRKYVVHAHGGRKGVQQQLVFAHNDTQYGNLLRLKPSGESPLLIPDNEHKQLVVIDFEYASQNLPGYEFANHFTEWAYNYHHDELSWFVNPANYPKPEEQRRFIRAYLQHRPNYTDDTSGTQTPKDNLTTPHPTPNPLESFKLDSRSPKGQSSTYEIEEKARTAALDARADALIQDARLWRGMCSAHWVAWGLVQAEVPGMPPPPPSTASDKKAQQSRADRLLDRVRAKLHPQSDPLSEEVKEKQREAKQDRPEGRDREEDDREGDSGQSRAQARDGDQEKGMEKEEEKREGDGGDSEEAFDYLAYAQDRALFFWGDALQLGLVKESELPSGLREKVKVLKY